MSEEIKVSDEARECAENEADAYLCGRELGHHVQSLLTHRDEEIAELRGERSELAVLADRYCVCASSASKPTEVQRLNELIVKIKKEHLAAMSKDAKGGV